ncbi:DUF3899 domain-containing protein [Paenibacillus sp. UMB4589-SE434]|uniref:DUF3899 domain-containing protein n=1 Tax=Paenibacillus sp. UMB4589-SE434 TaxID=3046314 RepID=UPI00254C8EF9|nr:DUF3899 domain-containing protein [Paenibacillus sp. UMB4589-SE434]MDK8180444.1 DUF3899 domain-containing protein [Paenibacillus sp. UMB4589-SE434]
MRKHYILAFSLATVMLCGGYIPIVSGYRNVDLTIINSLFLYGLSACIIGAVMYVIRTGFLTPVYRGFATISSAFLPKSRALQEEEKHSSHTAPFAWKNAAVQKLGAYFLGGGIGILTVSVIMQLYYF